MNINDTDIGKFQALYSKHFGIELDVDKARSELSVLVRQMEVIYQPITRARFDELLIKNVNEDSNHDKLCTT